MAQVIAKRNGFNLYSVSVNAQSGWKTLTTLDRRHTKELLSRADGWSVNEVRLYVKKFRKTLLKRLDC